jgi:toxin-antitoxin system PIN domain toxin
MSYAIDVDLLLNASHASSPRHTASRQFLDACVANPEILCVTWPTLMSYLRIATHARLFKAPLPPEEAVGNVRALSALPHTRAVSELEGFLDAYRHITGGLPIPVARDSSSHEWSAEVATLQQKSVKNRTSC